MQDDLGLRLWFGSSYQGPELEHRIREIFCGDQAGVERVASSAEARVIRFRVEGDDGARTFFYKEFFRRHLRDRLVALFRDSRARRAAQGNQLLLDRGFSTAIPVCLGEQVNIGVVSRNFLVTEELSNAINVAAHFKKHSQLGRNHQAIEEKRRFLAMFGRTIGRMHRRGIVHGDLRLSNIMVQDGNVSDIFLLDNERTRIYRKLPLRHRLKNIVQMNITPIPEITLADRLRFFAAYLEENPNLVPLKKVLMRRILKRTRQRLLDKGLLTSR